MPSSRTPPFRPFLRKLLFKSMEEDDGCVEKPITSVAETRLVPLAEERATTLALLAEVPISFYLFPFQEIDEQIIIVIADLGPTSHVRRMLRTQPGSADVSEKPDQSSVHGIWSTHLLFYSFLGVNQGLDGNDRYGSATLSAYSPGKYTQGSVVCMHDT
ncbi:hypothetical protein IE53DRAFT_408987 [Violaceomyces palustris]|uniref:Uncharacterized protein n=1 Tax=Violaceomyces palustris TaxID=1673888 RepID=A0ACD0P4S1_9BASI|nr:hypothetical protein IE53DRAFT_408987 [Violaceomyces palustris]